MNDIAFSTFDNHKYLHFDFNNINNKNNDGDDSSMCNNFEEHDDICLLKDLFFDLKISTRSDWTGLNTERRHDYKFWADVTHNFGFDILKCVFNIGSSYIDDYNLTTYHIKSVYGDELCNSSNYTMTLRNEVAFHLLSGMIENRIPGSIRLIIRGNGYTFFENRINELLSGGANNQEALCHNMNALRILLPYLSEYQSVNLSHICFQFVSSNLWKFMWAYVGVQLKTKSNDFNKKMFLSFLDLATAYIYGARGPGFLKRLHKSSSNYLWNSLISLISWSMDKEVLCKIITFVCDILLLSVWDNCHESIPKDVFKVLNHNASLTLQKGKESGHNPNQPFKSKDFNSYYSNLCISMLDKLLNVLNNRIKDLPKSVDLVYGLSSLSTSRLIIPYNCKNIFEFENQQTKDTPNSNVFPRVLPCFNFNCNKVYHIDLPHIHTVHDETVNFFYCKNCGIPSYCSERCFNEHWEIAHKELCPYFMNFPTFAKYVPKSKMSVISTMEDYNFNLSDKVNGNKWKLIF